MSDENIVIKNIKGISFECKHCKTTLSFEFATQQAYISECPNCGAEWLPQQLNIEALRNLKSTFKILSNASGSNVSLICQRSDDE